MVQRPLMSKYQGQFDFSCHNPFTENVLFTTLIVYDCKKNILHIIEECHFLPLIIYLCFIFLYTYLIYIFISHIHSHIHILP